MSKTPISCCNLDPRIWWLNKNIFEILLLSYFDLLHFTTSCFRPAPFGCQKTWIWGRLFTSLLLNSPKACFLPLLWQLAEPLCLGWLCGSQWGPLWAMLPSWDRCTSTAPPLPSRCEPETSASSWKATCFVFFVVPVTRVAKVWSLNHCTLLSIPLDYT